MSIVSTVYTSVVMLCSTANVLNNYKLLSFKFGMFNFKHSVDDPYDPVHYNHLDNRKIPMEQLHRLSYLPDKF